MKKLALALVCFASVAFMASCVKTVEHPEPSLAVMTGENHLYDGQTIDLGTEYILGFRAASNSETMKELATFNLNAKLYDLDNVLVQTADTTFTISGSEYVYQEPWTFGFRELVGKAIFTATVADVDGKTNSTTINVNLNNPAVELTVTDITWVRRGANSLNAAEMAIYGLKWVARDAYHANIQPLNENCKLYVVENNAEAYNAITTDIAKAAYFAQLMETGHPVNEYRNISTSQDGEYNDILAVIDANGEQHLILFVKAHVETGSFGTQTTITGKAK